MHTKILLAASVTFFSWIVLNVVWIAVLRMMLNAKTRAAKLPLPGRIALDTLTVLSQVLFRSPWYWTTVVLLVVAGAVFAVR